FSNDTAPTAIYTLSLHDALPISLAKCPRERVRILVAEQERDLGARHRRLPQVVARELTARVVEHALERRALVAQAALQGARRGQDRKSTRLNSSHVAISYAVFCL